MTFVGQSPPSQDTDCYRVGSGLGFVVDSLAGHWLVQTEGTGFPELRLEEALGAKSLWWKRLDKEIRESPRWLAGEKPQQPFPGQEHGVHYLLDLQAGYSQGLFVDQRLNRIEVRHRSQAGTRLLNLFAYTCGFSVVGALNGAISTSVDLSRRYLEWGKRNFQVNGLDPEEHYFTWGDSFDWLKRWKKSGVCFDGIIVDPPTFSRNGKKVFRVEKDYAELVNLARGLLSAGGWMLCCTNFRGMDGGEFERILRPAVGNLAVLTSRPMPPEFGEESYLKSVWIDL